MAADDIKKKARSDLREKAVQQITRLDARTGVAREQRGFRTHS